MKTPIQQHFIDKQNIVLNIEGNISDSDLKNLQQELIQLYKTRVGEILDGLFGELVPSDVHIKLDNLDIKLPKIEMFDFKNLTEFSRVFEKDFKKTAEKEIREKILKASRGKLERVGKTLKVSKWNILENFLEDGHYPSWASNRNDSIDKIFEELMQQSPLKVARMVSDLSRKNRKKVIDRIVFQFRGKYTDRLLSILYQKHGREVLKLVESVRRRLGQRYQAMRGQKSVNKAIMTAAFEYVLEKTKGGKKLDYSEKELSQYILEAIQSKYRHVEETDISDSFTAVKNEFKNEHSELDLLEYFLQYGSVPFWASTESKESIQELFNKLTQKKLVSLQRMIEKHRNDEQFIKRLVLQFSTEQIFSLLEPISSDNSRFLLDFLRELEASDISIVAAKETILNIFIVQRSRISKLEISKAVFEYLAEKKSLDLKDFVADFYLQIQERLEISYDLGRSELIRIILDIYPELSKNIPNNVKKRKTLAEKEKSLIERLETLKFLLGQSDIENKSALINERNTLRNELQTIRSEMQKLGISPSDSIIELSQRKYDLEKRLESLASDSEEGITLLKDVKDLKTQISKLQKKLLDKIINSKDSEQRLKLIRELDGRILTLERDKDRIQANLAELGNAIKTTEGLNVMNALNKNESDLLKELKKRESALRKDLKKIETDIENIIQVTDSHKPLKDKKEEPLSSENSKLDFLIFFLQYGSIPWWADDYRESSIESILKEFAEKDAEKLRQAFQRVGRNPVVWQRLVNQLNEDILEKVLIILFPNFAGFAVSIALLLQKIFEAKILSSLESVQLNQFKWSRVAETLFTMSSALNPQNFIKTVVSEIAKEHNISPSTLLEYISNLSENNPGTRFSIIADIVRPIKSDAEILELEKVLLDMAFKKRQEDEGLVIPEDKKLDVLTNYILKGIYQEITYKSGYSSPDGMGRLLLELMIKQPAAVEKLLENALRNNNSRRRLSQELPDEMFWEIVLIMAPATMPLVKNYIGDLGVALSDNRMSVAKEALLKYLVQLSEKPFIIREFMDVLLKDAEQITQRTRIALINEWKRKVYQAPSYSTTLIIALMQAEMKEIKAQSDASEDQAEKEQLKDRIYSLQMEYQQMSQRLAYLLNKELPQIEGDFEIPENTQEFYEKIAETEAEIEKLKSSMLENPRGEELLQQIMNQKQLAQLEGKLEILKSREPLTIRQLDLEAISISKEITENEAQLTNMPDVKVPLLPDEATPDEIEILGLEMENGYLKLKDKLRNLPPDEREDWVEMGAEMGWDDMLKSWGYDREDQFLKELAKLSLTELSEKWNAIDNKTELISRRIYSRVKLLIAKTVQQLKKEQNLLWDEIEQAENADKSDEFKKALLQKELAQNDLISPFFAAALDNNMRQSLMRIRNNIRQNFQRLRALADIRKANLAAILKEKLTKKIAAQKERRESLDKLKKESIELLKNGDKLKEQAKVKPEKEKKKKLEKPVDEPLFIQNAGLVILHPYYGRLFSTLNLTEKNKFVSEDAQIKAVHLLQYIATGKTEHPENDLVLNKILCGLPLSTPVPMDVGLTEDELKVASGLLSGAIANWTKMKTMSPDSLRGTFLLREGTIKEEGDRWKLKAEKGSFDILLKTLPWAFNFVRYGWLQKFIMVEWPLPG